MEKETLKLNKATVQAIAAYLAERPYKEVADIANILIYEANNQQIFNESSSASEKEKISE